MGRIVEPEELRPIFDKRGDLWTPAEIERVCGWLFESPQLPYLLFVALCHLGQGATAEDAEEAWAEFCAKRLLSVINTYDPSKGRRFWNYLLVCFKNFCHDEGPKIRRRRQREVSLPESVQTKHDDYLELEFVDERADDPLEAMILNERQLVVLPFVGALPPHYRKVIVMHYFEEKSVKEIAQKLDISESCVKVRLHRARLLLRECLVKKEVLAEYGTP